MPRGRLSVTITYPMRVALERMADRTGLHVTSLASSLLRGALDKELRDPEVVARVRLHVAGRTAAEWREETGSETVVENIYREAKRQGVVGDAGQAINPGGPAASVQEAKAKGRRRALHPMAGEEQVR